LRAGLVRGGAKRDGGGEEASAADHGFLRSYIYLAAGDVAITRQKPPHCDVCCRGRSQRNTHRREGDGLSLEVRLNTILTFGGY
jgi:hypothetical protein